MEICPEMSPIVELTDITKDLFSSVMFRATCFAILRLYFSKKSDMTLTFGVIVGSTPQTALRILIFHRPFTFQSSS